ncbi:MAG TPA: alpha/beta fold hydrolase, partial [bacterium]|nr:alpha/beta fold hydrolase [bacterium]
GLEGSSRAKYVRGTLARAAARGWNGAAINFRSCGPSGHRRPRTYHSGFTDDLDWIVQRLRARWRAPIGAGGFSLGGTVTLKWLGERGESAPVEAAAAVSVPYDLAACASSLDGPGFWARVYRGRFLRTLRRKSLASARRFPGALDADRVRRARTFAEFDDCVTARLFGFRDAADYWARSSSAQFVGAIRRPTLLVSAEDDPFIPAAAIPREAIAKNPALTLALFPHGGHVGFVEGSFFAPSFAAERMAVDFLAAKLAR